MGPRRILSAYLLLFGVAVPWYWQFLPIPPDKLVCGMPVWAFGAVAGSASISLLSGWILLRRWPSEAVDDPPADVRDPAA